MADDRVFAKCAWRLLPLLMFAYIFNYLDRTNIGFAALTMNTDLGFTPSVYGLGAGIFFISYATFQVPANLMLHRIGARRWIFCILAGWGTAATAGALIRGPESFYILRFLLGVAEAGFFPGIILYLTFWFPKAWLGRATALFMSAASLSQVLGGPLASFALGLGGAGGIRGWQWLFLLEGLPAVLIAFAILKWIPDGPSDASWLNDSEKAEIERRIETESGAKDGNALRALLDVRVLLLGLAYGGILFAIYGMNFWSPLLVQGMGFSNTANGFIVSMVYAAGVPAMIAWSRSSDRKGERIRHAAMACLLAAIAFAVASVSNSTIVQLLALVAGEIGLAAVLAPFYNVPALFLSGPAMASGFALISSLANLVGGFAGQYLIGLIRQETGGYFAVLGAMSAAMLIPCVILLGLSRSIASGTGVAAHAARA